MQQQLFTVYDVKAGSYMNPFTMPTEGMAIRAFMDSCADPDHAFSKHPEDYHLFRIGLFSDDTADILPEKTIIMTALEAKSALSVDNIPPKVDNLEVVN